MPSWACSFLNTLIVTRLVQERIIRNFIITISQWNFCQYLVLHKSFICVSHCCAMPLNLYLQTILGLIGLFVQPQQ